MLERFVKWLYGYLYVRIKGNSPERFMNLCNARKIQIWNIRKTEKGYEFNIDIEDFKRLPAVARKTKTRPYIIKRKGFPFYVKRIKPRKGLWIGGILFFMLLYILSSFIWDIQISGQHTYTEEALLKYLRTIHVYAGMRRDKVSCPDIETAMRETYTDIGWVSAQLKGSRLLIKIQETNMPSLYVTETTPKHLTASRSGIVDSIITRTGTPMVKAGDTVEKGDILISGVVEIYGDSGEVIKREPVLADGDVVIRAETSYYDEISKKYQKKEYTGTEKISYGISAFQYKVKQLYLWNPSFFSEWRERIEKETRKLIDRGKTEETSSSGKGEEQETEEKAKTAGRMGSSEKAEEIGMEAKEKGAAAGYDLLKENREIYLNRALKLPIRAEKNSYREYQYVEAKYSKEEMETILQKNFDYYIEKLMEKGVLISENNVKIVISESLGTMSGKITILEKADTFKKVEDDEWRMTEPDEYSGDNN